MTWTQVDFVTVVRRPNEAYECPSRNSYSCIPYCYVVMTLNGGLNLHAVV